MSDTPNPIQGMVDDRLVVANVIFGTEAIEVDFFDPRRQADGVVEYTKLGIERRLFLDEVEHLEELLRELIDDALVLRRK